MRIKNIARQSWSIAKIVLISIAAALLLVLLCYVTTHHSDLFSMLFLGVHL